MATIKTHLWLIDDHPEDANIHLAYLDYKFPKKFKITKFSDAELALQAIKEVSNRRSIDLVLLDIEMPKKSGWEIGEVLQKFNIPFLFYSSEDFDSERISRAAKLDAINVVSKLDPTGKDFVEKIYSASKVAIKMKLMRREIESQECFGLISGKYELSKDDSQELVKRLSAKLKADTGQDRLETQIQITQAFETMAMLSEFANRLKD